MGKKAAAGKLEQHLSICPITAGRTNMAIKFTLVQNKRLPPRKNKILMLKDPKGDEPVIKNKQFGSIATYVLILLNILVFLIIITVPNSREAILLNPEFIRQTPWTLFTVIFSHELPLHLIINMALVFLFGRELEQIAGSRNVLLVYILPGVLGSLTVIPYANIIQWTGPTVGASAAVFGVVAALAAIFPDKIILKGKVKHWMMALFAINLVITFLNPEISIGGPAHAIGIIAGYLMGVWLRKGESR